MSSKQYIYGYYYPGEEEEFLLMLLLFSRNPLGASLHVSLSGVGSYSCSESISGKENRISHISLGLMLELGSMLIKRKEGHLDKIRFC